MMMTKRRKTNPFTTSTRKCGWLIGYMALVVMITIGWNVEEWGMDTIPSKSTASNSQNSHSSTSSLSSSSSFSTSTSSSSFCAESDIEYFTTLARLGGTKWLSLRHRTSLQKNERYLAEIVVNTTTEHILRQSSSLSELQPHNTHYRRRQNQETETTVGGALPSDGPPDIIVDCKNPMYANVLTGNKDPYQKFIIDVVLFGFDADYLEIRLHDLYDYVDLFVVTEQSRTHKGIPKPIPIVPELLKGRLRAFREKVDYFYKDVTDVKLKGWSFSGNSQGLWKIEVSSRNDALQYIFDKFDNNNLTAGTTTTNITKEVRMYVVQNDGDEIIERTAMAHFRECEVKEPTGKQDRLFFPSWVFKRNVAWLQQTYDMKSLSLAESQQTMGKDIMNLRNYLWRIGPTIQSMSSIRKLMGGIKGGIWNLGKKHDGIRLIDYTPKDYHMGLGSANHFSNPSDPKLMVVKMFSTVDSAPYFRDEDFWKNALDGNITCDGIRRVLMECQKMGAKDYGWVPTHSMGSNVISFIVDHLPWIVRTPPYRYPWLYSGEELFHQEQMLYEQACYG